MSSATRSAGPEAGKPHGPKRILLAITALGLGGAERVLSLMANHWAQQGREVHVVTLAAPHEPFTALDHRVRLRHLGVAGVSGNALAAISANIGRVSALRRALRDIRPDCVIGFMDTTSMLCILAARGLGIPVIAAEHIDPNVHRIGRAWEALRRALYPLAGAVVVLTSSAASYFPASLQKLITVIPNPVVQPRNMTPTEPAPQTRTLVAMGRLTSQKGFDLLLEAYSKIARIFPGWRLVILGEGHQRTNLETQLRETGLDKLALLPGAAADPFPILAQADLFVLPSRFEGFPMTLCEALACGLPAVAFDCPSGPAEILRPEVDGLLVPPGDVEALAAALARLMGDSDLRQRMAKRAPEVLERFGLEKVLDMWEALLMRIARHEGRP